MQTFEEFKQVLAELIEEHGTGDELALVLWNAMNEEDDVTDAELDGHFSGEIYE